MNVNIWKHRANGKEYICFYQLDNLKYSLFVPNSSRMSAQDPMVLIHFLLGSHLLGISNRIFTVLAYCVVKISVVLQCLLSRAKQQG